MSLLQDRLQTEWLDLNQANSEDQKLFSSSKFKRHPVHVVYAGAQLFKQDTVAKLGRIALATFDSYSNGPLPFSQGLNLKCSTEMAQKIHAKVREKLIQEAVEDFRIDFEDGLGIRSDQEEDQLAKFSATELGQGFKAGTLPRHCGIRIKPFSPEFLQRSLQTLDLFLQNLLGTSCGKLPNNFVVTLPKVMNLAQVAYFCKVLEQLENQHNLSPFSLKCELMVETPQSLFDREGKLALPQMLALAKGRMVAAHFGTYDYTASLDITSLDQTMDHAACDFAKNIMKISLSGSDVLISDGATTLMPVAKHRGENLSQRQKDENRQTVFSAWNLSFKNITHSLRNGIYHGWDLHPAQLPIRFAALYAFFLERLEDNSLRLKKFLENSAKATLHGDIFDDAATGQGLLNYFLRGYYCGAFGQEEILKAGLTLEELESRSFTRITPFK